MFIMAFVANVPIGLAGMGLNAYFAFTVVIGMGVSVETALTAVFGRRLLSYFLFLTFAKALSKLFLKT